MFRRHVARLGSAIILSGLSCCAHAVELGDALVRSHIGQPLSADIELTGLASDTAVVQAALADPEVYRGASVAMHPALAGLNITIVRRDGRRFLHIASSKTVDADHLLAFFTLTENGQPSVRQATLWFTPDPNPAPPPPPAPAPAAPVAAAPAPIPVAVKAAPVIPVKAAAPAPAPKPVVVYAAPAPQPFTAAQIRTAAMLDAKNAALSGRIVELEEKVKTLGAALQATKAPAAAPAPVAKAHPPAAKPLPAKLSPMGEPVSKPVGETPWLFIGIAGVIMLALAGLLAVIRRGKRKKEVKIRAQAAQAAMPRFIASVRDRLKPAAKTELEPEPEAEAVAG